MMVSKGEIWLANLNPSKKSNEMGKVRPVLVYQNDE
ncbi:type II toxin-antitoxin system PemK/MazF family toxin, partial [Aliarcobacter butzleri]